MPDNNKRDNTAVFVLPAEDVSYYGGVLDPAVVTESLPKKFHGSANAAKRYSDAYRFGKEVARKRDETVPYVLGAMSLPLDIIAAAEPGTAAALGWPVFKTAMKNVPTVAKNFQRNWGSWSKAGSISPKHMLEYRYLEAKNGLRGVDIAKEAEKLGIDPRAYIQVQSRDFKKFQKNYPFRVKYHGTPVKDATVFPKPSDPDYLGKLPGTGTYQEGIYLTENPAYAERYSQSGIGVHEGPVTGEVHKVAIGGNPISIEDAVSNKLKERWPHDSFQHLSSDKRKSIEKLGYNIVEDSPAVRWTKEFDETMVFEPNQIKSLMGNNGDFSASRNIYKSDGGPLSRNGRLAAIVKRINETGRADFVKRLLDEKRKVAEFETGGFVERYGSDKIRKALSAIRGQHRFDGNSEESGLIPRGKEIVPRYIQFLTNGKIGKNDAMMLYSNPNDWANRIFSKDELDNIRQNLYDNIYPIGYNFQRVKDMLHTAVNGRNEISDPHGYDAGVYNNEAYLTDLEDYPVIRYAGARDEAWEKYLQPRVARQRGKTFLVDATELPSSGATYDKVYEYNVADNEYFPENLVESYNAALRGKRYYPLNDEGKREEFHRGFKKGKTPGYFTVDGRVDRGSDADEESGGYVNGIKGTVEDIVGGTYTISSGVDPHRGQYVSLYDDYDLNPFIRGRSAGRLIRPIKPIVTGDASGGIGHPFSIYNRVYLDDYYGVSSKPDSGNYYGGYIVPAIVSARRKH